MKIRELTLLDIPELVNIDREASAHPWPEKFFRDSFKENYYSWGLTINHDIVGFIIILSSQIECHVMNIAVKPACQRKGYAKKLLLYAIDFAKKKGIQSVLLEVRHSNKPAINLYEQLGAVNIGTRKNYYANDTKREDGWLFKIETIIPEDGGY